MGEGAGAEGRVGASEARREWTGDRVMCWVQVVRALVISQCWDPHRPYLWIMASPL